MDKNNDKSGDDDSDRCATPLPGLDSISGSSSMVTPTSSTSDPAITSLFQNLTPPKIKESECMKLSKKFGIGWDGLGNDQKMVISFLFDRHVEKVIAKELNEWNEDKRNLIVGEKLAEAMDSSSEIGKRVAIIVYERGHEFFKEVPEGVQTYDDFLWEHPEWRHNGDYQESTDFINLLEVPHALGIFQQVQLSGKCYLHAAVLMYHYLCYWHDSALAEDRKIDIPRYMRHSFSAKEIHKHLFGGAGGRSENVLKKLAGDRVNPQSPLSPIDQQEYRDQRVRSIIAEMKISGPQLFSNALLPEDFGVSNSHSFTVATSTFLDTEASDNLEDDLQDLKSEERHAMVLLGIRKDAIGGNWFFLFQNSHASHQFFEAEYDWVVKTKGTPYSLMCYKGTWESPSCDKPFFHNNDWVVYSQASPLVDKADSGDPSHSFTFSTGNEK